MCDYSDELINFVKKSIEEGIHINTNLYTKSFYYLTILGHKDKAESLTEFIREKNIININGNSNDKGSNGSKSKSNESNKSNNSNESTNEKTLNSSITNFNTQGLNYNYGYLNTINALNMCYYQKFCQDRFKSANANNTMKKETSLKEIFDNNKIYPFVYKNKDTKKAEEDNKSC